MSRTVLVTGATGYIGRHVVRVFLDHGYEVVGSTRDASRLPELKAAIAPALENREAIERLRLVELDLDRDEGWGAALQGVDALIHTASPFPLTEPDDRAALIRTAEDGARRAIEAAAAAGVRDVVLTSSVVAMFEDGGGEKTYDESDWTDPDRPETGAYPASKTLAERTAWELAERHGINLAVINPGLVVGPPLGKGYGSSVQLIERMLSGKDPVQPRLRLAICDVRDVALAHLRALEAPEAKGHRHLIADGVYWFREVAGLVKEAVPQSKAKLREAPNWLIRAMAVFMADAKGIVPNLGRAFEIDNTRMRTVLGIEPRDSRNSIRETALWLKGQGKG